MKIRLHLVRFMYINLILSCCFWLYDNAAAAADEFSVNDDAAAAERNAAGLLAATGRGIGLEVGVETGGNNPVNVPNDYKAAKEVASEQHKQATEEAPTTTSTATTTRQKAEAADSGDVAVKLGATPRTSAKTTTTTNRKAASDVKDTSVNLNVVVLPSSVNINNNNNNEDVVSVVPRSEKNTNLNTNNNDNTNANAAVPKSQLNNEINHNIYTNTQPDVNQLEQSQQISNDNNVMIPKTPPQQHQQQQEQQQESFSDIITELPSVTITELPLQLEPVKESLDAVMLQEPTPEASNKSAKEQQEQPVAVEAKQVPQKDEINDPGGGAAFDTMSTTTEANATVDINVTSLTPETESTTETTSTTSSSNETVEEVPMPVFSEWAQKQMEAEASREQAMELEQQVVNNSAQRKNTTGAGNGKLPSLKLRAKNYASPDCGAKIIASNADATNTGAVLSHSSDEYMLSTCGSRIWFVVELCEAVQAQKVELANFELFSSSPRNFTVAVSKRFPTRDWSNVGRFAAEDKRTVQTFELHPHLFGKFVRVDIHSHYSKEHFCPISLFRVFGTSEYEAFETEIRHSDELDDFDDDFAGQEQSHKTAASGNGNIFQSASDAVMQMVKKAAQVLVKPTKALRWSSESLLCRTPATGSYSCASCNSTIVERINQLLSCQTQQLQLLLALPQLRTQLLQTRVCQSDYDISLGSVSSATSGMDKRQSFYLSWLPAEHVGAMCKLLQGEFNSSLTSSQQLLQQLELKRQQQQHLDVVEQHTENITTPKATVESVAEVIPSLPNESLPEIASSSEKSTVEAQATTESAAAAPRDEAQPTEATPVAPTPADVNIFNVPSETQETPTPSPNPVVAPSTETIAQQQQTMTTPSDAIVDVESVILSPLSAATPTAATRDTAAEPQVNGDLLGSGNGMDDSHLANWENIDSLLTTTVASITAGGGAAAAAAAVVNGNANLVGGGGSVNAGATAGAGTAAGGGVNLQPKLTNGAQSESVFIRLSNRIKALERNMSLSGQYLEELSRRYKKQVEELQQTLTQQTLTVRTLEDQSRRYIEQEQLYQQQSAELAGEVRALTYQVQACILVVMIVGTCIFLMLVLGTVYYRKLRRQTQQLQPQAAAAATTAAAVKQNLSRRKSYEQLGEQSPGGKRRPSEEAMIILNGCGDLALMEPNNAARQRKISVCYGSNNNIAANMFNNARASLHRRKGVKHNSLDSAQIACGEHAEKFFDVETLKSSKPLPAKAAKKKSQQELKRQESAPANFTQGNGSSQAEESTQSDFDESLILDDDDLCNFIPNSDLAYNEFMPDGPSGYHIVDTVDGKADSKQPPSAAGGAATTAKKSRRVSSPAFFKSPFSKSKNKGATFNGIGGVKGSHSAHEATSWEWYRLKRNEKQAKQLTVPSVSVSANASLDSSSLSEINFPYHNSASQNSFRILEETILNADSQRRAPINGKASSSSSGSGSGASISSSSTTKKKPRVLNNIFRKVF